MPKLSECWFNVYRDCLGVWQSPKGTRQEARTHEGMVRASAGPIAASQVLQRVRVRMKRVES